MDKATEKNSAVVLGEELPPPEKKTLEEGACPECGKKHVDLRKTLKFEKQRSHSDCNITCKRIMKMVGVVAEGATGERSVFGSKYPQAFYQMANENKTRDGLDFYHARSLASIKYLNKELELGHPVLVGVNHSFQYRGGKGINEGTTDHFVIIVGRLCEKGETYYQYWDVATRRGASKHYRFKIVDGYKLVNEKAYERNGKDNRKYIVTQIRRNINENKK